MINGNGDVFRLYHQNERLALQRFINGCKTYVQTSNESYKEYWQSIITAIEDKKYTITKVDDFLGFRRVI